MSLKLLIIIIPIQLKSSIPRSKDSRGVHQYKLSRNSLQYKTITAHFKTEINKTSSKTIEYTAMNDVFFLIDD